MNTDQEPDQLRKKSISPAKSRASPVKKTPAKGVSTGGRSAQYNSLTE